MSDSGAGEAQLREQDLRGSWFEQLREWLQDATAAGIPEPNAMVLATADAGGRPAGRTVLLKGLDERGLVFYSNRGSRKGRELGENPRVAAVFPWYALRRQVIVDGSVSLVSEDASDEYFASRPYRSRIGALASRQSSVIAGREELELAAAELEAPLPAGRRGPAAAVVGRVADRARCRRVLAGPARPPARPPALPPRRRGLGRRAPVALAAGATRRRREAVDHLAGETATVRSWARIRSDAFFQHTSCSSG